MTADNTELVDFYTRNSAEQWSRFDKSARLEDYVLSKVLSRYFPRQPAQVIDVGGGNGRHAFQLAESGYRVDLCDITPELVADAQQRNSTARFPLNSIAVADARQLPWTDSTADAALIMGPLYCLKEQADRLTTLRETLRALKPGAPVVAQFFTRVGGLRWVLEAAPVIARIFDWKSFLSTGVFTDEHIPDAMRVHYYSTPEQAAEELKLSGIGDARIFGMDGPAPSMGQLNLAKAPRDVVSQWGEVAYHIGSMAENISSSTHILAVGRKAA
ncbi:class I SAM-dependent methyltransferase [Amycolatopsis sp. CA-128772]|uniref:class I SAM-dependent methyltransferase n=1 Tax=Amycolatopsis sp. CA-128772 TaxID=2073159 RepID=UPI001304A5E6|nr:class I SAM-dependent methyltransferase [Amycolatopsis sp. CA-128772]